MNDIRYIVELKLKHNREMYRKFQEVGNKTAMHDFSCRINILEDVLEDAANEAEKAPSQHYLQCYVQVP